MSPVEIIFLGVGVFTTIVIALVAVILFAKARLVPSGSVLWTRPLTAARRTQGSAASAARLAIRVAASASRERARRCHTRRGRGRGRWRGIAGRVYS